MEHRGTWLGSRHRMPFAEALCTATYVFSGEPRAYERLELSARVTSEVSLWNTVIYDCRIPL